MFLQMKMLLTEGAWAYPLGIEYNQEFPGLDDRGLAFRLIGQTVQRFGKHQFARLWGLTGRHHHVLD